MIQWKKVIPSGIFGGLGSFNQHQKRIQNPARYLGWSIHYEKKIVNFGVTIFEKCPILDI